MIDLFVTVLLYLTFTSRLVTEYVAAHISKAIIRSTALLGRMPIIFVEVEANDFCRVSQLVALGDDDLCDSMLG